MTQTLEKSVMALIVTTLVATVVIYAWDRVFFTMVFAAEDGPVETATALFLLIASLVLGKHALALSAKGRRGAAGLTLFYALLFFLAAGEEISWGQRIIGWESGEFFQENNQQVETNVHNLVVFGSQLTKTLFGPVLTAIILVYLVVLPLLYVRTDWVQRLSDRFVVPVPWLKHGIIALSASILIALIDVDRKWEVYELVFSLIVVSIFLLPQNRDKVS